MIRLVRFLGIAVLVASCSAPVSTEDPFPTSTVDVTGILLVDVGEQVQAGPVTADLADALDVALRLAENNGNDLGYPWVDPATGELLLSVVTPRGRDLVEDAGFTVPHRIREVRHGVTELRRIQDDVTFMGARGVPGAELIFMTVPDHRDNRALIVMSALDRGLLEFLAGQYPVDAIAVQVDSNFGGAGPGSP